jgi:hypothetical protein
MTRSMLKTKNMPKEFLTEAVDCVIYLSNMCFAKRYGIEKSQVLLSIGYVHLNDQVRTKLDDKSKMMIFVGYDQMSKGYSSTSPMKER